MALFRTFIAVEVSDDVRRRVSKITTRLQRSQAKVSWTQSENLHLTLKFLGDTPDTKIPDVCRGVARAAATVEPFTAQFTGVGAFPRPERPRTVWVGLTEGVTALQQLQLQLEEEMYAVGLPRERRKFVPHLTVGRVRGGGPTQQELAKLVQQEANTGAGRCNVHEVVTIASFLNPEGPTYQVLGRAPLGT